MKDIKELLIEAIANNELERFLKGEKGYSVKPHHWLPASIPTDWSEIMPRGIYRVYTENPEYRINNYLEDTLLEMISGDTFSLYVAVNVVFDQLLREYDKTSPFRIGDTIKNELRKKINEKQEDLKNDFSWMGNGEKEGLWSEIKRIDRVLKDETGMGIL